MRIISLCLLLKCLKALPFIHKPLIQFFFLMFWNRDSLLFFFYMEKSVIPSHSSWGFPSDLAVKNPANARGSGSIPRSGRSPDRGNGNPLQYSCLGNPMDTGTWPATVPGVAESDMTEWLSTESDMTEWLSTHAVRLRESLVGMWNDHCGQIETIQFQNLDSSCSEAWKMLSWNPGGDLGSS